jgi:hypothetical protein
VNLHHSGLRKMDCIAPAVNAHTLRTPVKDALADLHLAIAQIPVKEHAQEAQPLAERPHLSRAPRDRSRSVLARLGVGMVQSPWEVAPNVQHGANIRCG